jgi:hypothetical protein
MLRTIAVCGALAVTMVGEPARASDAPHVAGASTSGGLVRDTTVIRVTTLADTGPGSLRAALQQNRPRVIVFDVGGIINLRSDLRIDSPNVTVAGQTAPSPGVLIRGAKIRIVAPDVVLQHLTVHPILELAAGRQNEIDSINIGECNRCPKQVADVLIENVSAGWANDEVIGLWGDKLDRITIRNSIVAEGLSEAGHPKIRHSMGMLIGAGVQGVEVVGNLFASNMWRNPVLGGGASAYVANNFIYNPGESAIHFYHDRKEQATRASLIGNVVKRGPDTNGRMKAIQVPQSLGGPPAPGRIFASDNHCCSGDASAAAAPAPLDVPPAPAMPVTSATWTTMPARDVPERVFRFAGSRPADRSPIDMRILMYVRAGGGRIINSPTEVGGHPEIERRFVAANVPIDPLAPVRSGLAAKTLLQAWLCLKHFEVGGPSTQDCRDEPEQLRSALAAQ